MRVLLCRVSTGRNDTVMSFAFVGSSVANSNKSQLLGSPRAVSAKLHFPAFSSHWRGQRFPPSVCSLSRMRLHRPLPTAPTLNFMSPHPSSFGFFGCGIKAQCRVLSSLGPPRMNIGEMCRCCPKNLIPPSCSPFSDAIAQTTSIHPPFELRQPTSVLFWLFWLPSAE